MRVRKSLLCIFPFIVLMMTGCSLSARDAGLVSLTSLDDLSVISLSPGEKLRVVTTTSILGDIVANVSGQEINLEVLLPAGEDPHSFQPTPQDLRTISDAHVVFINGLGLESFLSDTLESLGDQLIVVSLSEGVPARELGSHETDDDHAHHEAWGDFDPHVWLDPSNVEIWIDNIALALAILDPTHAAYYNASAQEYLGSLQELDVWIQDQITHIPESERNLVTDHFALGYFADRYGFEILGAVIPSFSTDAEASAQQLAALQREIQAVDAQALFVNVGSNPTVSAQLASDLDLQLVSLYIGTLSDAEGPAASYLDLMHYNVETIVAALQG
ncbi:MAG TPA: zinc ABC transporter substrate-binding protein [Anaerolineae bacterium]|nr:zinc ABC transporter substrate-binding protein [Anaerolineae bacterium]